MPPLEEGLIKRNGNVIVLNPFSNRISLNFIEWKKLGDPMSGNDSMIIAIHNLSQGNTQLI